MSCRCHLTPILQKVDLVGEAVLAFVYELALGGIIGLFALNPVILSLMISVSSMMMFALAPGPFHHT